MRGKAKVRWAMLWAAVALTLVAAAAAGASAATPGSLDPGFGTRGVASAPSPARVGSSYRLVASAAAGGGKVVALLNLRNGPSIIARYTASGRLDAGFSGDGMESVPVPDSPTGPFDARDVAVDAEGRVLLVGNGPSFDPGCPACTVAVLRYLPQGGPDPSFGAGGIARPDFRFGMVALPPSPLSVTPTETETPAQPYGQRVRLDGAGRVLIAGTVVTKIYLDKYSLRTQAQSPMVGRLLADGRVDAGFGVSGATVLRELVDFPPPAVPDLDIDALDRPVLATCTHGHFSGPSPGSAGVFRLTADGGRDDGWAPSGQRVTNHCPLALSLRRAGGFVVLMDRTCPGAGLCRSYVERWRDDGSLARRFGTAGRIHPRARRIRVTIWTDLALDGRDRILLAGPIGPTSIRPFQPLAYEISRRRSDGRIDRAFGVGGRSLVPRRRLSVAHVGAAAKLLPGRRGGIVLAGTVWPVGGIELETTRLLLAGFRGGG